MKVALLSSASSIHTVRWANALSEKGLEVHVISQHPQLEPMDKKVKVHLLPFRSVLGYFTMVPSVRKILNEIKPDILNAHYASGYGTTARLVNYRPWLLSVWGSDVYDFPYKSFLHKRLVQKNLLAADAVASTSVCMAEQVNTLAAGLKQISITPFGVDTAFFQSLSNSITRSDGTQEVVVGTVKSLAPTYGIDTLIKAFAILFQVLIINRPEVAKRVILRIVGSGPQEAELKALTTQLNISDRVFFVGQVDSTEVPKELGKFDIYVALSRSESFGVAIIEASATGRPVVVSDAGGLPEVVVDGVTGIIVPTEDPQSASDAILKLILDRNLRIQMGDAGKQYVARNYDWHITVDIMKKLYEKVIEDNKKTVSK